MCNSQADCCFFGGTLLSIKCAAKIKGRFWHTMYGIIFIIPWLWQKQQNMNTTKAATLYWRALTEWYMLSLWKERKDLGHRRHTLGWMSVAYRTLTQFCQNPEFESSCGVWWKVALLSRYSLKQCIYVIKFGCNPEGGRWTQWSQMSFLYTLRGFKLSPRYNNIISWP